MIDPAKEVLIPLNDARESFPGHKSLSRATLNRWQAEGVRGVRLETIVVGRRRFVSKESIERFVTAQNSQPVATGA